MGCGGTKEKKDEEGPGAPVEKKGGDKDTKDTKDTKPAEEKKKEEDMHAKSAEVMSADLKNMMQDYFNRYDLDGSCTINSTEELKQLCTNLVVKLDLELDVQEIDALVAEAGDMTKNNWAFDEKNPSGQCFAYWFLDKFGEKHQGLAQWKFDDLSSEEDDFDSNAAHGGFYRQGTYEGELLGADGKKYCKRGGHDAARAKGAKKGEDVFIVKIRYEKSEKNPDGEPGKLVERTGCDGMGYFRTEGKVDGEKFSFTQDYDIDNDKSTLEPKLILTGEPTKGEDGKVVPGAITGTWVNGNASDEKAQGMMKQLGLEGCTEGTFTLQKKKHDDA